MLKKWTGCQIKFGNGYINGYKMVTISIAEVIEVVTTMFIRNFTTIVTTTVDLKWSI